jgi:hypothetical protein
MRVIHHLENIDKDSETILVEKTSGIIKGLVENPDISMTHDAAVRITTLLVKGQLTLPLAFLCPHTDTSS